MHAQPHHPAAPFPRNRLRLALRLACAMALSTAGPLALAQAANPAPARGANAVYDIPASPLAAALNQFAQQAGVAIALDAGKLRDLRSPGLKGRYGVEDGFAALLAGSGQALGRTSAGYLLVPAAETAPPAAAPARPRQETTANQTLGEVTVTANQLGEITEGTRSYTPGAIATATRLVLSPRETPQTVSVVTRQQMDDFGMTSIDDVIRATPGVSIVTYDSERTEYYARGFAIQNFQYDGIPMRRDSAYSAGNTLTDTSIYDRVEVLKGATGLLTGSGEPGATINLVRKKPTRAFQGQLSASAGSWNTYRTEADLSGALNESGSVRGRVVAALQDRHSQLDHYKRSSKVFYGVLEADLTPSTLLTVGADYQDNDPKGSTWGGIPIFNSLGNFNSMPRSFNNGARWSGWGQYTRTGFSTLEHQFGNGWVAKVQYNHQINGYDALLGAAAGGNPNPLDGSGTSMWLGKYVGRTTSDALDAYASGPFKLLGREHELVVGASIARRRWKNDGYNFPGYQTNVSGYYGWTGQVPFPVSSATPDFSDNEVTRERGLYAATRLNLSDRLKLIAGARVSSYRNKDIDRSGEVAPYAGLIFDLTPQLSAYGSYTTIFMPQSSQDVNGRTLDPQDGKNQEVGLKGSFLDGKLNASLAYFHLEQNNYPEATGGLTPRGGQAYRAIQGVVAKGVEAEVSGELAPGWQLHAGFTHKVAKQDRKKVSTLEPEDQFSLYTTYRLRGALQGWTLGGGARWQSKSWGDASNPVLGTTTFTTDAYWLFDLMARYEFSPRLSATLRVNNALDKKYMTVFSWYSTYTWGEPRSVNVNLVYKF
ncbi:TonB-dependent siderophore receptor [Variovorax paradoxus]|uniref:TonB-dependent siderophore receptor n=1 Tax=Variovorax paradoxus (strain EPS) TaxID=595537 RepID=E6UYZ9_VARPE|nr:TonB-dependent siderophore receptor [Variovorax paradoxus]ADU34328.1 TonB-dependent siderophore receptor [Variovorax paradoxus EPS]